MRGLWGDRVGWNRERFLCFHPADPSVRKLVTKDTQSLDWLHSFEFTSYFTLVTTMSGWGGQRKLKVSIRYWTRAGVRRGDNQNPSDRRNPDQFMKVIL